MLPENYIVKTTNSSQTTTVIRFIDKNEKNFSHWNFVTVVKNISNIFNQIPSTCSSFPVYSFEEWDKLKDEKQMPKKWVILSTPETSDEIHDFIVKNGYGNKASSNDYYIHYPFTDGGGSCFYSIQHGYTEINFTQFKQITNMKKYTIQQLKENNYLIYLNKENHQILSKYLNRHNLCEFQGDHVYSTTGMYSSSSSKKSRGGHSSSLPLIKFEDIILEDKKIIGYKAPTDLFNGKVKAGAIYKIYNTSLNTYVVDHGEFIDKQTAPVSVVLPFEIVSNWEPVYEKETKTIIISNRHIVVEVSDKFTFRGGKVATFEQIKDIYNSFSAEKTVDNYTTKVIPSEKCIRIGCIDEDVRVSLDELYLLITTYNSVNGI